MVLGSFTLNRGGSHWEVSMTPIMFYISGGWIEDAVQSQGWMKEASSEAVRKDSGLGGQLERLHYAEQLKRFYFCGKEKSRLAVSIIGDYK